jgi:hypothetical protein
MSGDLEHLAMLSGTPPTAAPAAPTAAPAAPTLTDVRVAAQSELDGLKGSPEWVKSNMAGDHNARADFQRLTELIARPPAGVTLHGGPTTEAQRADAADFLANSDLGLSDAHVAEIREGRPNSPAIYAEAMRMKRALMGSAEWRAKYFANDPDARRQMKLINIIESNPVAL